MNRIVLFLVFFAIMAIFCEFLHAESNSLPPSDFGLFLKVSGTVSVIHADGTISEATVGMRLVSTDRIRSATESSATLACKAIGNHENQLEIITIPAEREFIPRQSPPASFLSRLVKMISFDELLGKRKSSILGVRGEKQYLLAPRFTFIRDGNPRFRLKQLGASLKYRLKIYRQNEEYLLESDRTDFTLFDIMPDCQLQTNVFYSIDVTLLNQRGEPIDRNLENPVPWFIVLTPEKQQELNDFEEEIRQLQTGDELDSSLAILMAHKYESLYLLSEAWDVYRQFSEPFFTAETQRLEKVMRLYP